MHICDRWVVEGRYRGASKDRAREERREYKEAMFAHLFELFEHHESGGLPVPELARMLTTMGETPLSKEEMAEFLAVADQVKLTLNIYTYIHI